jgi:hypothetical protein
MTGDQPVNGSRVPPINMSSKWDLTLAEVEDQLPYWDIWMIPPGMGLPTYSAKPKGASKALPVCRGLYDLHSLVREAKEVERTIDTHIETTRQQLDRIDEIETSPEVLQSRLDALIALRDKLRAD